MNKLISTALLLSLVLAAVALPQNSFPAPSLAEHGGGVSAVGSGGGSGSNGNVGLGLTQATSNQLAGGLPSGSIFSLLGIGRK